MTEQEWKRGGKLTWIENGKLENVRQHNPNFTNTAKLT